MSNHSSITSASRPSSVKPPMPGDTHVTDKSPKHPVYTRTADSKTDKMQGAGPVAGLTGRDYEARLELEKACQSISTHAEGLKAHHVPFAYNSQQGVVSNPHGASHISLSLGRVDRLLEISPYGNIVYRGTRIANLTEPELRAATGLANAAVMGLKLHRSVNGQDTY